MQPKLYDSTVVAVNHNLRPTQITSHAPSSLSGATEKMQLDKCDRFQLNLLKYRL